MAEAQVSHLQQFQGVLEAIGCALGAGSGEGGGSTGGGGGKRVTTNEQAIAAFGGLMGRG